MKQGRIDSLLTVAALALITLLIYAAFGYGKSDRAINMEDANGVALAAIQGLYQLLQEKDAQIDSLQARLASLEALVDAISEGPAGGE